VSLFAVYDGHGGAEVAQYTSQHFPQHIIHHKNFQSAANICEVLEESFLSFDAHLKQIEILQKLRY
jgi:protein phosphatase 1G